MLAVCAPLSDLWLAAATAFGPTLSAVAADPWLLLAPRALSRIVMAHVWDAFSAGVDQRAREAKILLITPHARGCVLDVGAGAFTRNYVSGISVTLAQATDTQSPTSTPTASLATSQ